MEEIKQEDVDAFVKERYKDLTPEKAEAFFQRYRNNPVSYWANGLSISEYEKMCDFLDVNDPEFMSRSDYEKMCEYRDRNDLW